MLLKILTSFCTVLVLTFHANAADPNANELIHAYEKSLSALDRCTYHAESKMNIEGVQEVETPESVMRKSICYRDGDRWATIVEDRYSFRPNSQKTNMILRTTMILDKRYIMYPSKNDQPVRAVYVASDLKAGRLKSIGALGGGAVAEGHLFGDEEVRLPDILRSSSTLKVVNDRAEIDGFLTYVLESRSNSGKIKLWLDPESGFHPRRIEVHKSGNDLLNGRPVSSIRSEGNIVSDKQLKEYSLVIDSVNIENIEGVFVMTGANTVETKTYVDGHKICATYSFKRSKINLHPDFNVLKVVEIKVPDGTPVRDQNFPAGRFMVLGGKIVPADEPTFDEIDKMVDELKK